MLSVSLLSVHGRSRCARQNFFPTPTPEEATTVCKNHRHRGDDLWQIFFQLNRIFSRFARLRVSQIITQFFPTFCSRTEFLHAGRNSQSCLQNESAKFSSLVTKRKPSRRRKTRWTTSAFAGVSHPAPHPAQRGSSHCRCATAPTPTSSSHRALPCKISSSASGEDRSSLASGEGDGPPPRRGRAHGPPM